MGVDKVQMTTPPFSKLVVEAMSRRGLGLRELCRQANLDPSFMSKVLAGKRNPPSEDDVLRRLAVALDVNPVELFVAAGRLPSEWKAIINDPELLRRVDAMATSAVPRRPIPLPFKSVSLSVAVQKPFAEELL